ncbi:T-complex protein 11-like protein 1 [Apostichopus japonicus]|uniref:T-complex protein 11-like protein 1 n=1 Tax=Stichopus japonicus TaxID=307972 RepID=UPI003AB34F4B
MADKIPGKDASSLPEESKESKEGEEEKNRERSSQGLDTEEEAARKRLRQTSPKPSPRFSYSPIASPHKHATFEELLAAADHIEKLSLAHELATDENFKLTPTKLPENSLQKMVHEMMHKAFWDILSEQLESDPPIYHNAISLLKEVKEMLMSLTLPHQERLRNQINGMIDVEFIQQQAEHSALDVSKYSEVIISTMAKLCAPVRDDEIEKLRSIEGLVPLYREIFRVLDLMKLDMANFALESLKPHMKQQSVEYERNKFEELLKTQQDGLNYTRRWLLEAKDVLSAKVVSASSATTASSSNEAAPSTSKEDADTLKQPEAKDESDNRGEAETPGVKADGYSVSPICLINQAFVSLIDWDFNRLHQFPETMLTDQSRFLEMQNNLKKACLIASVLLVTYTNVGPAVSGIQGFPSKVKYAISVIVGDVRDFDSVMVNIAEQVCIEVTTCLNEHNLPKMEESLLSSLKTQIVALGDEGHAIRKLIDSRAKEFLLTSISCPPGTDLVSLLPASLKTLQRQMFEIALLFSKLVRHNRSVYGPYYSQIIANLLQLPR